MTGRAPLVSSDKLKSFFRLEPSNGRPELFNEILGEGFYGWEGQFGKFTWAEQRGILHYARLRATPQTYTVSFVLKTLKPRTVVIEGPQGSKTYKVSPERETPVTYGEIHEADQRMLRRQKNFRNAARAVTDHLAAMPEVQQVRIFGSVALPLWKEVHHDPRFRHRNIRIYHEYANIDLAVRVTSPAGADRIRKAGSRVVADLNEQDIYLEIALHTFSIHLIDHATGRYLGMACHFNQCPKHKRECQVPGCGAAAFVRILPGFRLKPHRLNEWNSQVLY